METIEQNVWQEERDIRKKYRYFYEILGGVVLVSLGILIGLTVFNDERISYFINIFTTGLGFLFSVFVFDVIVRRRGEQSYKKALILQMGSPSNDFATEAVRILRNQNWLFDGSLENANLERSDLRGAHLEDAMLRGVNLNTANLQKTTLYASDLRGAWLIGAHLEGAVLHSAKLQEARLGAANLVSGFRKLR